MTMNILGIWSIVTRTMMTT